MMKPLPTWCFFGVGNMSSGSSNSQECAQVVYYFHMLFLDPWSLKIGINNQNGPSFPYKSYKYNISKQLFGYRCQTNAMHLQIMSHSDELRTLDDDDAVVAN